MDHTCPLSVLALPPTLLAAPTRLSNRALICCILIAIGRYCCKSPKLPGANFPAVRKSDRRPPIDVASITLPWSPASFSSDNEVPHIFTWKSTVQPKEILIASAKRLLQQNRHIAEVAAPIAHVR